MMLRSLAPARRAVLRRVSGATATPFHTHAGSCSCACCSTPSSHSSSCSCVRCSSSSSASAASSSASYSRPGRQQSRRQLSSSSSSAATGKKAVDLPVSVLDKKDLVYPQESFYVRDIRKQDPVRFAPGTFSETWSPHKHLLSFQEQKGQALDPKDFMLPVDEEDELGLVNYVLPGTGEAPREHSTAANIGKYFPLEKTHKLCEGIAKSLEMEVEMTEEQLLMVRKPAVQVIAGLEAFKEGDFTTNYGPAPFTLLTGPRLSGKSATLAHIVDYARSNGFLTLFMPRMHSLLHDTWVMEPSRRREGFFDQPAYAKKMLEDIGKANGHLLSTVAVKTKGDPEAAGRLDNYDTLDQIAAQFDNDDPQIDHTGLVLDLLREFSVATEAPVLLALDDYNHLYQPTGYFYDAEPVLPEQLTLVNALRYFQPITSSEDSEGLLRFAPQYPLRNGVVVAAEGQHRVLPKKEREEHLVAWRQVKATSERVTVPLYSMSEVESCMRHYYDKEICFEVPTNEAIKTVHLLTNGVPSDVLLRAVNPGNFLVDIHYPQGQPGSRQNHWMKGPK